MLVQVVTLLIFVAIIGSILYGRRLIKTENYENKSIISHTYSYIVYKSKRF